MIERRIKELAIALEALSRVVGEQILYERVRDLLGQTVEKLEEEHSNVGTKADNNDDIPF